MKIKCHAKINLSLNVYENINSLHKIESLVQTLKLHDVLKVKFYKNILNIDNININHIKDVPYDKNLIIKAIKEFSKYKILNNLSINLLKNIPSKAGLGGASSDAFGILKILNTKYRNTLNNKTLIEISSKIGLDVPLFFSGGTTLIENFGDKVIKLKDLPKFYVILIKPNFSVSTKEAYENIDKIYSDKEFFENNKKIGQINHKKIIKNIKDITKYKKNKQKYKIFKVLNKFSNNDFEKIPYIKENIKIYKENLKNNGADFTQMSGSGSVVYGLFHSKKTCNEAFLNLSKIYKNIWLTESIGYRKI